jgi:hypothetical protein
MAQPSKQLPDELVSRFLPRRIREPFSTFAFLAEPGSSTWPHDTIVIALPKHSAAVADNATSNGGPPARFRDRVPRGPAGAAGV